MAVGNPPRWAEKAMKRAWPALRAAVGPARLPAGPGAEEFGCGHYGCVWPTQSGQVVKITSDKTEASFVAAYLRMGGVEGMVGYHQIFRLAGTLHRGRPVFVIWRDEAWDVGELPSLAWGFRGMGAGKLSNQERYDKDSAASAVRHLGSFKLHAAKARDYLKARQRRSGDAAEIGRIAWEVHGKQPHWTRGSYAIEWRKAGPYGDQVRFDARASAGLRGVDKVATHLAACAHLAEIMATSVRFMTHVGGALDVCLERGILLCDVHSNNVGKILVDVDYPDELGWGITDPGHAVFLTPNWDDLTVPELAI